MAFKSSAAALAALLALGTPLYAQTADNAAPAETPATDAAPADAAPADAAPADAAPADAAPAEPASPQVGAYYARETHGDWTLRCIKTDGPADPCELYQLLKDGDGNAVAEFSLVPLAEDKVKAGATLVTPLETDLIHGIGLQIDSAKPRAYPFNFCAPVGCVSRMGFTGDELNALKRGAKATVMLLPVGGNPEQPVQLGASLAGFTAGMDALVAVNAANAEAIAKARAEAAEAAAAAAAEAPAEKPADAPADAPADTPAEAPAEAPASN